MPFHVAAQDCVARRRSTRASQDAPSRSSSVWIAAATARGRSAIVTRPSCPQSATTSGTGVETTGTPAARNSGVLVGLMNRVASFKAKGMNPACQCAR